MIKAALVDVEAMFKLLHEGQEVADLPNAQELVVGKSADVRFEDVVFTFEPKMGPILKGVSLEARAGQKLAVVGASGAGKSTLARLLYRLYNVEKGRILISGMDIATCTQRSVRLAVGIVPQDCCLFNDTLRYNISIGKLARGELASDEEVASATAAAQLSDFVARQPQRFDTVVGERGLRLSGGEKQRVAIARALLKQPAVLACDEATSALDSHTEKEITEAMNRAAVGRTYIVIAHRLSTIADADIIAVLDQGLIAEAGTHAELLACNGLYASMWQKHQREGASRSESTASLAALAT
jgi:ABC-type transport system involved in Fe-S cluster assembly fused permease/ATPase subunit